MMDRAQTRDVHPEEQMSEAEAEEAQSLDLQLRDLVCLRQVVSVRSLDGAQNAFVSVPRLCQTMDNRSQEASRG